MSFDPISPVSPQFRKIGLVAGALMLALAGCQSGNPLDLGVGEKQTEPEPEKIDVANLRLFCPSIQLRSGTAFYNTYERGKEQDPEAIIYQASATEVTRDCQFAGDNLTLTVAMAGRVIPGPKGQPGTITMPIRVAVVNAGSVVFSELYKYQAPIGSNATPFVFRADNINVQKPAGRTMQIFIGYDEGPYDTQ